VKTTLPRIEKSTLAGALAGCLLAASSSAWAQQAPPAAAGKPSATAQKQKGSDGDAGLRQRVEQLEEQLVDLQVVIGTLESLARSGGSSASASQPYRAPAGDGSDGRIDALETQIRALTQQVDQLSGKAPNAAVSDTPWNSGPAAAPAPAPVTSSQFGSTTVNSSKADEIGGLIESDTGLPDNPARPLPAPGNATERLSPAPAPLPPVPGQVAALDPAAAGSPKQDYERAYGYLLQQDYGAAQAGFTDFLKQYPKDSLVPNALYWLGETHYVQKNFGDAAEAFDIVTQAYGSSSKAPDSQLKRGMSLAQLGKKQEACSVLGQVATKFASAPPHVKSKADGERQRIGCP
jgi:tol-pal system protein YbgF